jgi:predicted DNA-binding antitoxin AbrB/MazE fold protein
MVDEDGNKVKLKEGTEIEVKIESDDVTKEIPAP